MSATIIGIIGSILAIVFGVLLGYIIYDLRKKMSESDVSVMVNSLVRDEVKTLSAQMALKQDKTDCATKTSEFEKRLEKGDENFEKIKDLLHTIDKRLSLVCQHISEIPPK